MPLINLRTNLKTTSDYTSTDPNLAYGHDRKGGGSSDQPFITTDIPDGNKNVAIASPDFFLRNGVLNFTVNSKDDVLRLGKWFLGSFNGQEYKERVRQANENTTWSNVGSIFNFVKTLGGGLGRGLIFTAKQTALGRQETIIRTGTGQGLFTAGANKYYNPINTILQAGVLSAGYHLNQKGLNPFDSSYFVAQDKANGYYGTTLTSNRLGGNGGEARLSILFNAKQTASNTITLDQQTLYLGVYNGNLTNNNVLFSYNGGPGSFLGIGKTDIRIWNPLAYKTEIYSGYAGTITYLSNTKGTKGYLVPNGATTTFSSFSQRPFNGYLPGGGAGNGGNTYKTSQTSFNRSRANSVNSPQSNNYKLNPNLSISPDQDFTEGDDIIDFSFTLINNEGINATNPNTFINFRAYIDDFNDSYTGDWDSYRYMGRAENFYRYKGFTREMSVSFTVPVLSRADMVTTYQKLNALTWLTMPDYSDVGIMRGNLAYFTMGDYLRRSIVVVKSLNYTPIMEMGFDINRAQNGTAIEFGTPSYVGQLPKGMRVTANIIPLTNAASPNSPNNFYTPQRGETFIGNRTHAVVDRNNIATQYNETLTPPTNGEPYVTNNPNSSFLISPLSEVTLDDPTINQSPTITTGELFPNTPTVI